MGEGQTFKGKLIGVLEVGEARGDRMCQDALQELKTAVKASGEHKQKVIIHVAVDGLKIRDEKNGVSHSLFSTRTSPPPSLPPTKMIKSTQAEFYASLP